MRCEAGVRLPRLLRWASGSTPASTSRAASRRWTTSSWSACTHSSSPPTLGWCALGGMPRSQSASNTSCRRAGRQGHLPPLYVHSISPWSSGDCTAVPASIAGTSCDGRHDSANTYAADQAHDTGPRGAEVLFDPLQDIKASLADYAGMMVDEESVVCALVRLSAIYSHLGCAAPLLLLLQPEYMGSTSPHAGSGLLERLALPFLLLPWKNVSGLKNRRCLFDRQASRSGGGARQRPGGAPGGHGGAAAAVSEAQTAGRHAGCLGPSGLPGATVLPAGAVHCS